MGKCPHTHYPNHKGPPEHYLDTGSVFAYPCTTLGSQSGPNWSSTASLWARSCGVGPFLAVLRARGGVLAVEGGCAGRSGESLPAQRLRRRGGGADMPLQMGGGCNLGEFSPPTKNAHATPPLPHLHRFPRPERTKGRPCRRLRSRNLFEHVGVTLKDDLGPAEMGRIERGGGENGSREGHKH